VGDGAGDGADDGAGAHPAEGSEADAEDAIADVDLGGTDGWARDPGRAPGDGIDAMPMAGTSWRDRDPLPAMLVVLTGVTGAADAVSFLALGQVFTANMTGNIALLGFSVAGAADLSSGGHLLSLAGFVLGALAGGRLLTRLDGTPKHRWVVITATLNAGIVLLAAATAIGLAVDDTTGLAERWPTIALLATAMGVRNAMVHRLHVADLPVSVVTSTLTGLLTDSALAGHENVRPLRRAGAVVCMFLGALFGGLLVLHLGAAWTLLVVAVLGPGLALTYALHPGRSEDPMRTRA
jgi:uncharacterized membrane protein YoaK (UPF0700 family)